MGTLIPTASLASNRYEHAQSTLSLFSILGTEFGSRYIQVDESGVYLSSLAVTILMSSVATIGILLFTLFITLAVLVSACGDKTASVIILTPQSTLERCNSFRMNAELNNVQDWIPPPECETLIFEYIKSGQYQLELQGAVDAAEKHLKTVPAKLDGSDIVIMDIDETTLSNLPYYYANQNRTAISNTEAWNQWVKEARAPAIAPMLNLFNELRAANWGIVFIAERPEGQRNYTVANLLSVGYADWISLILRSENETSLSAATFKSKHRLHLQKLGYHIQASIGDQWNDIKGPATGNRTFKVPNPMYYIC